MTHIISLKGCTPTPLAHYLKALGVLRLVAEDTVNGDPNARGFWHGEHFVLESRFDEGALRDFFLNDYRPTPIVAPWNGGSGFYQKDNKAGIDAISGATALRFEFYKEIIEIARGAVRASGLSESPKDEAKQRLLTYLRNSLPDAALRWLDAAVLITADLRYPPLLGTGGNDGRLDFTNNLMQRLAELFSMTDGTALGGASALLMQSLFGVPTTGLSDRAIGQFAPGAAGGPNASIGFSANSLINTWDFVLMLEGALLFGAVATRRLEQSGPGTLAYPFTVRSTGAGSGAVAIKDEGNARAEIWLPLWSRSSTEEEIRVLLGEGRASLARGNARDGLDFARAVAALGVDRGIDSFQRVGFLMRSGKAYLATPLGRFSVCRNPDGDLISELDQRGWLDTLRRFARGDLAPNRLRSLTRQLEDGIFLLTRHGGRQAVQEVLCLLGELHLTLADSRKGREALRPLQSLSSAWLMKADDGSAAFRIAAALAGIYAKGLPMRSHLLPLDADGGWLDAGDARRALTLWTGAGLVRDLIAIARRRLIEAERRGVERKPFESRLHVGVADIAAFLADPGMDAAIERLLPGFVLCELPSPQPLHDARTAPVPVAYTVLRSLFTPDSMLFALNLLPEGGRLPLPAEVLAQLAAGDAGRALETAWRRLRASGFPLPDARHPPQAAGIEPERLAAALTIPLSFGDTARLLRGIAEPQQQTV